MEKRFAGPLARLALAATLLFAGATALSAQAEWQLGWTSPPSTARSRYWYDMSTGKGYERTDGETLLDGITGTA